MLAANTVVEVGMILGRYGDVYYLSERIYVSLQATLG